MRFCLKHRVRHLNLPKIHSEYFPSDTSITFEGVLGRRTPARKGRISAYNYNLGWLLPRVPPRIPVMIVRGPEPENATAKDYIPITLNSRPGTTELEVHAKEFGGG